MYKNIATEEIFQLLGEDYGIFVPHATLKYTGQILITNEKEVKDWDSFIHSSGLVGPPGAHSRQDILHNITRLIDIQKKGEDGEYGLDLPIMAKDDILNLIVEICGNCPNPEYRDGEDWVSLNAFKKGMLSATEFARKVLGESGVFLLATGHPKSLIPAYAYIGKHLVKNGDKFYIPSIYPINEEGAWLGSICGVNTVIKSGSLEHSHSDCGLDTILNKENAKIDLAIADHGLAAATIRMGIPTIAIVDTNDSEVLVAASIYRNRVFPIPMHDNAGFENSMAMAYYFEYLMERECSNPLC